MITSPLGSSIGTLGAGDDGGKAVSRCQMVSESQLQCSMIRLGLRFAFRNGRRGLILPNLWYRRVLAAAIVSTLVGCSVLPQAGPTTSDIVNDDGGDGQLGGYVLIDVDERVASIRAAQPRDTLKVFGNRQPAPDVRIGVGDAVSVTIWEAASGGLFSAAATAAGISAGSRTATLPDQTVPRDGTIQVPYAGRLQVAGLRPAEVETLVVQKLQGKAIEPQAVVTITRNTSNTVTLTGEVVNGMRVPLTVKGDRILDVIAAAGGIRFPAHESVVQLTRDRKTVSVAFNALLSDPNENIFVRPNDAITVVRVPQTFTAFGGTGRNASVPFDAAGITLEEAIAKAGGLLDSLSDPSGIFLLRFEPAKLVSQIVPNRPLPSEGDLVPVIYRLNLRHANSFFLARAFRMNDKDILYVSNAPAIPVQKFLALIGQVASPVLTGAAISSATK